MFKNKSLNKVLHFNRRGIHLGYIKDCFARFQVILDLLKTVFEVYINWAILIEFPLFATYPTEVARTYF